jgi:hypothetical protein
VGEGAMDVGGGKGRRTGVVEGVYVAVCEG